jgi:hypothetical protein
MRTIILVPAIHADHVRFAEVQEHIIIHILQQAVRSIISNVLYAVEDGMKIILWYLAVLMVVYVSIVAIKIMYAMYAAI